MKLVTTIQPRADRTVIVRNGADAYQFHTTRGGRVVGDVDDDEFAAELVATGNFAPIGGQKAAPKQSVEPEGASGTDAPPTEPYPANNTQDAA